MSSSLPPSVKVPPRFVPTLTEVVQVPDLLAGGAVADAAGGGGVSVAPAAHGAARPVPLVTETASVPPLVWDSATPEASTQPAPLIEKVAAPVPTKDVAAASLAASRAAKSTSLTMSEMLAKLDALPTKKSGEADKPKSLFTAPAFRFEAQRPAPAEAKPPLDLNKAEATPATPSAEIAPPPPLPRSVSPFALREKPAPATSSPVADATPAGMRAPLLPPAPSLPVVPPAAFTATPPHAPSTALPPRGAAAPVTLEKMQRPVAAPASLPIVDKPKASDPPVAAKPTASLSIPEGLEEYLVHRVMQRVDLALEKQLQDAVERVIKEQTQSLVTHLREEVESVVRQSVYEAVAQELVVASESSSAD